VGLALGLFTLVASVIFHAYWSAPAAQQYVTQLLFMKNISVSGGMFLISALGAGPLSLDARRGTA
jgi:putative oxidoreductase